MNKNIFKRIILSILVFSSLFIVGCKEEEASVDYESIVQGYVLREAREQYITDNFELPLSIDGQACTWTSSDSAITLTKGTESYAAEVYYPESGKKNVTLTLTCGSATRTFALKVREIEATDAKDSYEFDYLNKTIGVGCSKIELETSTSISKGHQEKDYNIHWTIEDEATQKYCSITEDADGTTYFNFVKSIEPYSVKVSCEFVRFDGEEEDEADSANASYEMTVSSIYGFTEATTFTEGTKYLFGLYQSTLNTQYFSNGAYYGSTEYYYGLTTVQSDAASFYVKNFEDGTIGIYCIVNGTTKYVKCIADGTHSNVKWATTESEMTHFTYDSELGAFKYNLTGHSSTDLDGAHYLGTYDSNRSISIGRSQNDYAKLYILEDSATLSNSDKVLSSIDSFEVESISLSQGFDLPETGLFNDVVLSYEIETAEQEKIVIIDGVLLPVSDVSSITKSTIKVTASIGSVQYTKNFEVVIMKDGEISLDFKETPGFSSWSTSYSNHKFTYNGVSCEFTKAVRGQQTIMDMPVIRGFSNSDGSSTVPEALFTLTNDSQKIDSLTVTLKQWTTKVQTVTIYYTVDGSSWVKIGSTITCDESQKIITQSFSELSVDVVGVRFLFNGSTYLTNQIGFESLVLNVSNK